MSRSELLEVDILFRSSAEQLTVKLRRVRLLILPHFLSTDVNRTRQSKMFYFSNQMFPVITKALLCVFIVLMCSQCVKLCVCDYQK